MADQQSTPLSPDEMAMGNMQRGDASKGEMEVSDGETECAGCDAAVPEGAAIYWRCSSAMECDPYCTACAREEAMRMQMVCDAIEDDHQAGRLFV